MQKITSYLPSFLFVLFIGCELFNVREVQPPADARSNFLPAISADIVIQNLISSLSDKNTQNYISCLSNNKAKRFQFVFLPSAEALSKYPVFLEDWSILQEEQYFNNVTFKLPEESSISLTLQDTVKSLLGDSVYFSAKYSLTVPHTDISIPNVFQGEFKLKLFRDENNLWSIFFWQDIKNSSLPSWSELKGVFY